MAFIDDTMNHALYLIILKGNFKLSAQNLDTGNNFVFYQDNGRKRTFLNISHIITILQISQHTQCGVYMIVPKFS